MTLRSSYLIIRPHVDGGDFDGSPQVPVSWTVIVQRDGWYTLVRPERPEVPETVVRDPETGEGVGQGDGVPGRPQQRFDVWRAGAIAQDVTLSLYLVIQREPEGRDGLDELAGAEGNTWAQPGPETWRQANLADGVDDTARGRARAVLRHWPDWRVSGFVSDGDGGSVAVDQHDVRILQGEQQVPNFWATSAPWHFDASGAEVAHLDASEVLHVTQVHRPAFMQSIAGFDDPGSVETTEGVADPRPLEEEQ